MKWYIYGKPVSNVKDILNDGQDYILIIDEGCFSHLNEIEEKRPIAAISDYNLLFSHIPSFFQMFSIPLFFIPENRDRAYVTYYERTQHLTDNINSKVISTLEEVRELQMITIDTLLNVIYMGTVEEKNVDECTFPTGEFEDVKIRMAIKFADEVSFKSVDADGIGVDL